MPSKRMINKKFAIISESRVYDCGSKKIFGLANLEMSLLDKE